MSHGVRIGESFGEPVQLGRHFPVTTQDVPEPLAGEPDLASAHIGETLEAILHHPIPYRKVYRSPPGSGNIPFSNSMAAGLRPKLGIVVAG